KRKIVSYGSSSLKNGLTTLEGKTTFWCEGCLSKYRNSSLKSGRLMSRYQAAPRAINSGNEDSAVGCSRTVGVPICDASITEPEKCVRCNEAFDNSSGSASDVPRSISTLSKIPQSRKCFFMASD